MNKAFVVNGKSFGGGNPSYIIAEMSCNHHQSFEKAIQIIDEIAKTGANAVKTQVASPDTITLNCNRKEFVIEGGPWGGKTLHELYQECYTPWEWHFELKKYANKLGLDYFASPFSVEAVDLLEKVGVPLYKIASFEMNDFPILKRVAETKKPVIVSTGMASQEEINETVTFLRDNGAGPICLLKCTSAYPAPVSDMNLITIPHLASTFNTSSGLSDHSLGTEVSLAAVVLGASVIEKHFIISRDEPGPDSSFSMEPHEFAKMVTEIRNVEQAIGSVKYGASASENPQFRRSLFIVKEIKKGEIFSESNIQSIRPGYGLPPKFIYSFFGKKAAYDIERGTPVKWDMIEDGDKK